MSKYIDSHCHLPIKKTFGVMFSRANSFGVVGCVLNSVTQSDWAQIVKISEDYTNVIGSIGIHPWYADVAPMGWDKDLKDLLNFYPKLIVGEIGLDKTRGNFVAQEKIFRRSLEIAIEYNRTVNLHCVHAWDIMLNILKSYRGKLPKIVIHSFDGTQNVIDFDADLYFSYSPNIADNNCKKVASSVIRVPKNRILVESDGSDFLPVLTSVRGVLGLRSDLSENDIFENSKGVFFYG